MRRHAPADHGHEHVHQRGRGQTGNHQRDAALAPLLVLVTDGRANAGQPAHLRHAAAALAKKQIATLVLDSEQGFVRLGKARELAGWLEAKYLLLDELRADAIAGQVRQKLKRPV